MKTQAKALGRVSVLLAGFGLAGRLLIPSGFMPAPLAGGWPIKLCPGSFAGGQLLGSHGESAASHHRSSGSSSGRHDDGRGEDGPGTPCPLGIVFSSAAELATFDQLAVVPLVVEYEATAISLASVSSPLRSQPRGPPGSRSLDA